MHGHVCKVAGEDGLSGTKVEEHRCTSPGVLEEEGKLVQSLGEDVSLKEGHSVCRELPLLEISCAFPGV